MQRIEPTKAEANPSRLPSDEAIEHWTMRNGSANFDGEAALKFYREHEGEFDADADEFIDSLQ